MASINDTAGIFTGSTLDDFNQMEAVVLRDGDVAYAQQVMRDALLKLITTTQLTHSTKTGAAVGPRKP